MDRLSFELCAVAFCKLLLPTNASSGLANRVIDQVVDAGRWILNRQLQFVHRAPFDHAGVSRSYGGSAPSRLVNMVCDQDAEFLHSLESLQRIPAPANRSVVCLFRVACTN